MNSLILLIASLAGSALSYQDVIETTGDLIVTNDVLSPDGFSRGAIEFGPLIKAHTGDNIRINVVNQLTDRSMPVSTSIHWHGLFQRGSSWADGPEFVTQCPIVPNESFEYSFEADHPGTFWYHSHVKAQYCDGLRGPLVIYDSNDPYRFSYDYDNEHTIITLADWYHVSSELIRGAARPDSTLINGVGRYKGGPKVDLAVIHVEPGKRYRFRLVSIACDPNYQFSIDGHSVVIIEADGEYVQAVEVDSIQIFAAQRYSFILKADKPVGNYWIRADPNVGDQGFEGGLNSAILRYIGAPEEEPTSAASESKMPLRETDLHAMLDSPAPGVPQPGAADINIRLVPTFNTSTLKFQVNDKTFVPPETPSLPVMLQILSGTHLAQDLLPQGSVYGLQRDKVVELVIPPLVLGGPHPVHLHGHAFSVVRSAGSTSYNFENPVRRDVVSIGNPGDEVTIRFKTDNPGPWLFHCHIDFHFVRGFAVVFAEDAPSITSNAPPAWDELCPKYERFAGVQDSRQALSQARKAAAQAVTTSQRGPDANKGRITDDASVDDNSTGDMQERAVRHIKNPMARREIFP
ncbi:hypothetical protein HGRIS_003199 [Hohenbuehelia grisea]|uniref:Laccase n=1 Tax=Hohenbuehelia grisea TaxID=104357 RepID=A0ABR3JMZ9_9AGAR